MTYDEECAGMARWREGKLYHDTFDKDDDFFKRVDSTGGWPMEYEYVKFAHSSVRECEYSNNNHNSGWWTTVASRDQYLWWKLSDKFKAMQANNAIHSYMIARTPRYQSYP